MHNWQGPFTGLEELLQAWAIFVVVAAAVAVVVLTVAARMTVRATGEPLEATAGNAIDPPAAHQLVGE